MTLAGNGAGRPVIGLSTYDTEAAWSGRRAEAALLPMTYLRHIAAASGSPVMLPPIGEAEALLDRLDGLVVTGGPDVDPQRYGAARHPETQPAHPERDAFEAQLISGAALRHLPTLCICRGAQLLNVVRGGTLHQHLPDVVDHAHHAPDGVDYTSTAVRVQEGSRTAAVLGTTALVVACHHHQAVDEPGNGLVAVAWAEDGTIEALEDPDEPDLVAVQWHPEQRDDPALFEWLIAAARSARSGADGASAPSAR
jgi:putative glutamine amidotransferase